MMLHKFHDVVFTHQLLQTTPIPQQHAKYSAIVMQKVLGIEGGAVLLGALLNCSEFRSGFVGVNVKSVEWP